MSKDNWIVATEIWSAYPVGTKAKALMGGYWIKTDRGWHWPGGSTFATPGGDATGEICLPERNPDTQLPAEVGLKITKAAIEYANSLPFFSNEIREAWEAGATAYATNAYQAQQMLFRLASLVNADQKPDEKFMNEIKQYLDGTTTR